MRSITVHNGHPDTSLHTIFHMCHRSWFLGQNLHSRWSIDDVRANTDDAAAVVYGENAMWTAAAAKAQTF